MSVEREDGIRVRTAVLKAPSPSHVTIHFVPLARIAQRLHRRTTFWIRTTIRSVHHAGVVLLSTRSPLCCPGLLHAIIVRQDRSDSIKFENVRDWRMVAINYPLLVLIRADFG